jgi:hypothetical protein
MRSRLIGNGEAGDADAAQAGLAGGWDVWWRRISDCALPEGDNGSSSKVAGSGWSKELLVWLSPCDPGGSNSMRGSVGAGADDGEMVRACGAELEGPATRATSRRSALRGVHADFG